MVRQSSRRGTTQTASRCFRPRTRLLSSVERRHLSRRRCSRTCREGSPRSRTGRRSPQSPPSSDDVAGSSAAARWRWIAAASVVLLVIVSAAMFARRIMNPQVLPAEESEPALASWPRPSLQPAVPAVGSSRPQDVTTPVVTPPPVRPAEDKSLNSRPAAATTATPKPVPAPSATRQPVLPPSQRVPSRSSVASAAPVGPRS